MPKPNIILIIADQLRADALGFNNPLVHTPNIDSIQQHACTFENAFCASPVCTPSRAAILTGRYPSCTGAWNIGTSLNEEEQTLPDYLKDSGYFNVGVGKMHLRPQLKALDPKDPESLEIRDRVRDRDQTYYGFDKVIIV
jgi:arylsulfatase A-like enzyme